MISEVSQDQAPHKLTYKLRRFSNSFLSSLLDKFNFGLQDSGGFNLVGGHSYCIYIPPIRGALLEKTFYLVHFSFLAWVFSREGGV